MPYPTRFLIDACVMMDAMLPIRPRHEEAIELFDLFKSKNIRCGIPGHAFFEFTTTLITHFKHDKDKMDTINVHNPFFMNQEIDVFPISWESTQELKKALMDQAIPDLKSADLIYYCVAKTQSIPLITEDNKLLKICLKSEIQAYTIAQATEHIRSFT